MSRIFVICVLVSVLSRGASGGLFDSIKNAYSDAKGDVENALGLSEAPAPAGQNLYPLDTSLLLLLVSVGA